LIFSALLVAALSGLVYAAYATTSPPVYLPITITGPPPGGIANILVGGYGLEHRILANRSIDYGSYNFNVDGSDGAGSACNDTFATQTKHPLMAATFPLTDANNSWSAAAAGNYNGSYDSIFAARFGAGAAGGPCYDQIIAFRVDSEWWLNCDGRNPWYNFSTGNCQPGGGGDPFTWETNPPQADAATFGAATCQLVGRIRANFPRAKILIYSGVNALQHTFNDAEVACAPEVLVYDKYFDTNCGVATGAQCWANACGSATTTCTPTSELGEITSYAASKGMQWGITEWGSDYNDTAAPAGGGDFATYQFIKWEIDNGSVLDTYFNQCPWGIVSNCVNPNVTTSYKFWYDNTAYGGTFWLPRITWTN
jgi:hypothetical protein